MIVDTYYLNGSLCIGTYYVKFYVGSSFNKLVPIVNTIIKHMFQVKLQWHYSLFLIIIIIIHYAGEELRNE